MLKYYSNRIFFYTLCCGIVFLSSCSKELDLLPSDSFDDSRAFNTVADLNGGLIGAYASLGTDGITNVSLTSDECTLPKENGTGRGAATYRWQYDGSGSTITAGWGSNYTSIDMVNRALNSVDKVKSKPSEEVLKKQYKGEMLALRAYCHFELLRSFASSYENNGMGIPYMEVSEVSRPSRLSFGESIQKIKTDLLAAKTLIPASFENRTRITLIAVSAMQARVALYEKNWDDALKYSAEVIDAVPLADKDKFPLIWKDKVEDEVIWKLKRVSGDSRLGNFYFDTSDGVMYAPAFELINSFNTSNDVRYGAYIKFDDSRGAGTSHYSVNKYLEGNAGRTNLCDVKLYRTGEMYLIRAEAYAQKQNLPLAAKDLNALRATRITGYTDVNFADQASLLDALVLERYKELAFEGHRFFDLRRKGLPITREPADAINALGSVTLTSANKEYAYPIPNAEIRPNSNVKQNPLY
ncbi:RagB/SusD family nutrient uptake outer membrane protein [Pedobacter caeni]|nr:RagB/SusD family nutrient uptake outer membrane protein [Pedobacter caeni]